MFRNVYVSTPTKNAFIAQLSASSGDVFAFLSSLWAVVSEVDVKCKILICMENWIDISVSGSFLLRLVIRRVALTSLSVCVRPSVSPSVCLCPQDVSSASLQAQPLYRCLLGSLSDPELFEPAALAVVAVLRKFRSSGAQSS